MPESYLELLAKIRDFRFQFDEHPEYKFVNPLTQHWQEHVNFLKRFYTKKEPRSIILGLNGGKDGFNKTSIAFTDPTVARSTLRMKIPSDSKREPSSEKLFPLFLKAFDQDISTFFDHYHLANLLPFGVTAHGQTEPVNVDFKAIIKTPQLAAFAEMHALALIRIFKPSYMIAVGQDVNDFLRKILRNRCPDVIVIPAVHPARNTFFTPVEQERWVHILKRFKQPPFFAVPGIPG